MIHIEIKINAIYNMDCLDGMKLIPDKSIDMILCDLPYGTTKCKWDTVIPFEPLWEQYERIIKDNGVIALTASQPFTTKLINSNINLFKYEWIWEKSKATGFALCNKRPMKAHENVCIFYKKQPTYNPQKTEGKPYKQRLGTQESKEFSTGTKRNDNTTGLRYPRSVVYFKTAESEGKQVHPTQKPLALFEYLINTYTNEGELVLDNCIGSGTTAIACLNTNRNYIGFELDEKYYKTAVDRINNA